MFNFTKHFMQSYSSCHYILLETPALQLHLQLLSTALAILILKLKVFQMPLYLKKFTMINNGISRDSFNNLHVYVHFNFNRLF